MTFQAASTVLTVAAFAGMGAFVLARARTTHAWWFSGLMLVLATGTFFTILVAGASDAHEAARWTFLAGAAWVVAMPVQLDLVLDLARSRRPLPVAWRLVVYLPAVAWGARLLLDPTLGPEAMRLTSDGWARDFARGPSTYPMVAAYVGATLATLAAWWWRARDRRERVQAAWLAGSGFLAAGAFGVYTVAVEWLVAPPAGPRMPQLFLLIWGAGYAVAIVRHGLMELRPALAVDQVLGAMQDLFLLVDPDGRIAGTNARSTTLLGVAPGGLRGRSLASLAADPAVLATVLDGIRVEGGASRGGEVALLDRDGKAVPVFLGGGAIRGGGAEALGLALVAQDLRPVRELVKAERMESIGALAGGIAHDFNNLLTGIQGYLELATSEAGVGSTLRGRLEEAAKACRRAQDLTQQLLTFSRGGAPIRRPTSLAEVVRESASFAASGATAALHLDLPDDLWVVDGDPGQLARVVHNLVLNAVQVLPGGGTIRVAAANVPGDGAGAQDSDRVRLTVSDDGPGIPAELRDRVFEPFFTTRPSGTGLGLAVSHSIVRRHSGVLSVRSGPAGTTFQVDLPRGHLVPGREAPATQAPAVRRRVLVMDDQALVRAVAADMLRELGCEADLCPDGAEAVREHRAALDAGRPYDVVILDLTVPGGVGGAEAAREIRRCDAATRLVVSSGYAEDPVMAGFREHGFDAVLPKPYTLAGLQAVVLRGWPGSRGPADPLTPMS